MRTREELAWAAGFFDGEGHAQVKLSNGRYYGRLQVGQVGSELLLKLQSCTGLGRVKGPYDKKRKNWNPIYFWDVSSFEEVQAVIAMLWPWLGTVKKEQMRGVLLSIQKNPPVVNQWMAGLKAMNPAAAAKVAK